jgi:UDP-3-O-[3-hydroxymyristoyl] N-acetylglucosamine deacetylase/3-hydroxyacyl-[acyl-carrier-protein] dehydratase
VLGGGDVGLEEAEVEGGGGGEVFGVPLDADEEGELGVFDAFEDAVFGVGGGDEAGGELVYGLMVARVAGEVLLVVDGHELGAGAEGDAVIAGVAGAVFHVGRMEHGGIGIAFGEVLDERAAALDVDHLAAQADAQQRDLGFARPGQQGQVVGLAARVEQAGGGVQGLAVADGIAVIATAEEQAVEGVEFGPGGIGGEDDGDAASGDDGAHIIGRGRLEGDIVIEGNADAGMAGHRASKSGNSRKTRHYSGGVGLRAGGKSRFGEEGAIGGGGGYDSGPETGGVLSLWPVRHGKEHVSVNPQQRTIGKEVSISGRGLFTGAETTLTFKPAPPGHGVVFVRTDRDRPVRIPALVAHVTKRSRRTAIRTGADSIETIEHCMAALAALGIDNVEVAVSGGEVPGLDGSCLPFVEMLLQAGLVEQVAEKRVLRIAYPIEVRDGDMTLMASPPTGDEFQVFYNLDYGPDSIVGQQLFMYNLGEDFRTQIAPCRTFVTKQEADYLQSKGMGTHLQLGDVVVLDKDGPIGTKLRFPNEPVRHKILDLIGDLYLLGCPIQGKIVASKSGHSLNHALVRKLVTMLGMQHREMLARTEGVMDIRRILRMMPHRYPMLLVDRVVEMDGDKRAVGVKNVTVNEPFFQGHYPGTPVMPGVLIVEAMAQLAGLLVSRKLEHTGKIPLLLSLDKVRLRRPVVPGDRLILEAENIRVKARTGHVKCQAWVEAQLAAEATIKFMLVDDASMNGANPG